MIKINKSSANSGYLYKNSRCLLNSRCISSNGFSSTSCSYYNGNKCALNAKAKNMLNSSVNCRQYSHKSRTDGRININNNSSNNNINGNNKNLIQKRKSSNLTFSMKIKSFLGLDLPPDLNAPTDSNRFHIFDDSPVKEFREMAQFMRNNTHCPITGKLVKFVCPVAGIPTHYDEEAWKSDTFYHKNIKNKLHKANIYDHDLRSGRDFPEFDFPEFADKDNTLNFFSWDTFFITRGFPGINTEFQLAGVSKMLSYPITIGSIIYPYGPYMMRKNGRLTYEGLKSLAALRYSLWPKDPTSSPTIKFRPARFFILGARAESRLPAHVWRQLEYLFPDALAQLVFIGPESLWNAREQRYMSSTEAARLSRPRETPVSITSTNEAQTQNDSNNQSEVVTEPQQVSTPEQILDEANEKKGIPLPYIIKYSECLSASFYTDYFHVFHKAKDFFPYDPYLDAFFLFMPGLGNPRSTKYWEKTIPDLLESKCPIFVTGFSQSDMETDYNWLMEKFGDDLDILITPGNNFFGSTKWEIDPTDVYGVYQNNQKLFGFRGKRYPAVFSE